MNLDEKFRELREKREGAFMPHVYYGDSSEEFSLRLIKTLVENGADFIEFGIPFSDPTADGPTFQSACSRALGNNITPSKCILGIKKLREDGVDAPITVTTYYNIPFVFGVENFLNEIKRVGAQAIIVPDVPFEEAGDLLSAGKRTGVHVVLQVAPTTTEGRLKKIIDSTSGFLYAVGVEGVTGERSTTQKSTLKLIERVRRFTDMPVITGFGISKKEHAKAVVSAGADGVVVGSALCKIYEKNLERPEQTLPEIADFVKQMKCGCVEGYRQRFLTSR
jgi:tryptophan synthase alpha chain